MRPQQSRRRWCLATAKLELELGSLGGLGVEIMASIVLLTSSGPKKASEGFWFPIWGLQEPLWPFPKSKLTPE